MLTQDRPDQDQGREDAGDCHLRFETLAGGTIKRKKTGHWPVFL